MTNTKLRQKSFEKYKAVSPKIKRVVTTKDLLLVNKHGYLYLKKDFLNYLKYRYPDKVYIYANTRNKSLLISGNSEDTKEGLFRLIHVGTAGSSVTYINILNKIKHLNLKLPVTFKVKKVVLEDSNTPFLRLSLNK